jgi:hypothetical protein
MDMDNKVASYIEAIPPEHCQLLDRVHRLILEACPAAEVVLSYKMPTDKVGKPRLHVAARKHGISIRGWKAQGDGGFTCLSVPRLSPTGREQHFEAGCRFR